MSKMSDLDVDIQENGGSSMQAVLREIAKAKIAFQQRSILSVMGINPEATEEDHEPHNR